MYSFMVAYELLHLQFQFMDLGKVIVVGVILRGCVRLGNHQAQHSSQFMIRPDAQHAACSGFCGGQ
jgi:hypothetical protein